MDKHNILSQNSPMFDLKIKSRSPQPMFHSTVVLLYILKSFLCMNMILYRNDSV